LKLTDEMVDLIVKEVVRRLSDYIATGSDCVFDDMDQAVEACRTAQKQLVKLNFAKRAEIIDAIRRTSIEHAEELSLMTVDETKMGNYEDKVVKNQLVASKTPGIEDLRPEVMSGDNGLTLTELSPFGVIGAITPTTNPTETIICNTIGMVAAGNGVVFSPHPTAKNTSLRMIRLINSAIIEAGGPENIITTVSDPTIAQVNKMIAHPHVNMLVATGGPGVVKAVLSSGKKAIGAGAGNPPAIVDETANIEKAAKDIIAGCSFDNNLPCIAEKEIIVVDEVADYLMFNMKGNGAYFIDDPKLLKRLEELIFVDGKLNKGFIGKSAPYILDCLGVTYGEGIKVISMEAPLSHPFVQEELMMPILPVVRVKDFNEALDAAIEVEHGYQHTAIMHSVNVERLSTMAKEIQTTIFVKNGPSYAGIGVGGEGCTTFTIAGPTGEGLTTAKTFTRRRRCVLVEGFNIR
jgi:propionaldehyde dehydrogenase